MMSPLEHLLGARDYALNYVCQCMQSDIVTALTDEMHKYPKSSVEYKILNAMRFNEAYGSHNISLDISRLDATEAELKKAITDLGNKLAEAVFKE